VLFFPVFGILLIAVGYYPERRTTMRLLESAFTDAAGIATSGAGDQPQVESRTQDWTRAIRQKK